MKNIVSRLFAIAMTMLVCVSMWGCGWDEDVEELSDLRLIGYSGDSLVVYVERKYEETCAHKPAGADCSSSEKGTRIVVDNFYAGQNVWKSDKIRDKYIVDVYDLVNDSTIIEFDKNKRHFYKWTLGKDSEYMGDFEWTGCSTREKVGSIRPWGDGKWRLVGSTEDCGYAIVDVEKKKITGYEKLDEFAEGCSDLWDHEGVKYCVGTMVRDTIISYYERGLDGVYLKNEDKVIDSLWGNQLKDGVVYSTPRISYKNSFLRLATGCCDTHLLRVDYKMGEIIYEGIYGE